MSRTDRAVAVSRWYPPLWHVSLSLRYQCILHWKEKSVQQVFPSQPYYKQLVKFSCRTSCCSFSPSFFPAIFHIGKAIRNSAWKGGCQYHPKKRRSCSGYADNYAQYRIDLHLKEGKLLFSDIPTYLFLISLNEIFQSLQIVYIPFHYHPVHV